MKCRIGYNHFEVFPSRFHLDHDPFYEDLIRLRTMTEETYGQSSDSAASDLLSNGSIYNFIPGTVGTFSNHGFEMTGNEEVRQSHMSGSTDSFLGLNSMQVEKINQDRGSIEYPLADNPDQALFCVFDEF